MMWNTIATFKENLSQIALDVQDAVEELEVYGPVPKDDASISNHLISHRFAQSKSPSPPATPNGIDSGYKAEIERYKAEIQRLKTSEAEVKALSVNYANILKEKEEALSRLNEENGSLSKALEALNAIGHASRNESLRSLASTSNMLKVAGDKSPCRQQKHTTQTNVRPSGNLGQKGTFSGQDASSNGSVDATWSDGRQRKIELKHVNLLGDEKLADLLEENKALTVMQANHESEIKELKVALAKEHENLVNITQKFQGHQKMNESSQKELHDLEMDRDKISMEVKELRKELDDKISEIKRLQSELTRRDLEDELEEPTDTLRGIITTFKEENANLKREKDELETALKLSVKRKSDKVSVDDSGFPNDNSDKSTEAHSSENAHLHRKELSAYKLNLEKALNDAYQERDKALQELARLKQHLLDKELEESDKMDEDSKIIEELRANSEYQRAQILHLENALKQAILSQEEVKKANSNELQKSNEIIDELKNKLMSCMSLVDSKNVELLNLQTALGQYYAEIEAKECLERDLSVAREELTRISELLKGANQRLEVSKQEKEAMLSELSQAESMLAEKKLTVQKLEEENLKLRRGLEQSMTRLNRMSMDSDYFVDRRIVVKLLVTYFQRNHSKEVLDLMVRILGFSEEDKQRIGFAQHAAGKGVVRGVLGLPRSLVGGILGGRSPEVPLHVPSESQSFADLWVDFLLKETEERERRELAQSANTSSTALERSASPVTTPAPEHSVSASGSKTHSYANTFRSTPNVRGNQQPEHLDSEFSTVSLASSGSLLPENSSEFSRMVPRY